MMLYEKVIPHYIETYVKIFLLSNLLVDWIFSYTMEILHVLWMNNSKIEFCDVLNTQLTDTSRSLNDQDMYVSSTGER